MIVHLNDDAEHYNYCHCHQTNACTINVHINEVQLSNTNRQYISNTDNTTLISFSDGMRVSNAHAVIPNIATIGNARMKYGEFAQLKHIIYGQLSVCNIQISLHLSSS